MYCECDQICIGFIDENYDKIIIENSTFNYHPTVDLVVIQKC